MKSTAKHAGNRSLARLLLLSLFLLLLTYFAWLSSLAIQRSRELNALAAMEADVSGSGIHSVSPVVSFFATPLRMFRPRVLWRFSRLEVEGPSQAGGENHLLGLTAFSRLETLRLAATPDVVEALPKLGTLKHLKNITLGWKTEWGNPMVCAGLPVTTLKLSGVLDDSFLLPDGLPLRSVFFEGEVRSLASLEPFDLENLSLSAPSLEPEHFATLGRISPVHLTLHGIAVDARCLREMGACPATVSLSLEGTKDGQIDSIMGIESMQNLAYLFVERPPENLSPLVQLPHLQYLKLSGSLTPQQLATLNGAPSLLDLRLHPSSPSFDEEGLVDLLASMPSLGSVRIEHRLTRATIDGVLALGLTFDHRGAIDPPILEADYFLATRDSSMSVFQDRYWSVVKPQSGLALRINADHGYLEASIWFETDATYSREVCVSNGYSAPFIFQSFEPFEPGLQGRVSTNKSMSTASVDIDCSSFDGTFNNRLEILSVDPAGPAMEVHVRWSFSTASGDEPSAFLDVRLPLRRIEVYSAADLTAQAALKALVVHVPHDEFPVMKRQDPYGIDFWRN